MAKLALVWGAAFALRLLYIFQSQRSPFYDFPLVDAKTYTQAAAAMALGHFGDQPPRSTRISSVRSTRFLSRVLRCRDWSKLR